jgi:FkbM family methyltransferase|tara:strand:- start:133 stop:873 length:741 start_codon:yes stop_codon:yes gene_type:complete
MVNKLNIDILRWVFRAWRYRLKVEKQEINFMLSHLKPGQTAIDIGAHKGAYTYWMSKYVGKYGKVFAFEPQPELYNQFNKLLKNSSSNNVNLELLALSSSKGEATMVIPGKKTSPSASINNNKREGFGAKITVEKTTLDDYFCSQNQIPVNYIKCDVEGHELDVLIGAQKLLHKYQPIIALESEARHCGAENVMAVFNLLHKLNYNGYFFNGELMSRLENFDIYEYQLNPNKKIYVNNFFFIPKNN